ncbi:MAG: GNAT family N-acetyltransferase [Ruminococcaceae bacterium]|nr:GNAT family N-acetyltransferase [Oscillospiraceae bacterium]
MIKNIKDILCSEEIYNIYSACMFEPTFDKFKLKTEQMQKDSSVSVYGYFSNEKIIGVISTQETDKTVEIIGIAVDTKKRRSGIGTKLIDYVKDKSSKPIIAETDSDAVMFYKKYGFDIEEKIVSKSNISYSRYVCTLNYK